MSKKQKNRSIKKANNSVTLNTLSKKADNLTSTVDSLDMITKNGFEQVDKRLGSFEKSNAREHEEIKVRLDNVAYRFELAELEKRVEILEKKLV